MARRSRRHRYDVVHAELDWWLPETVRMELSEWAAGEVAVERFGLGADAVDALFLMAERAREVPPALATQVAIAREQGHTWEEVADALGVSRQAAVKRFGTGMARSQQTRRM